MYAHSALLRIAHLIGLDTAAPAALAAALLAALIHASWNAVMRAGEDRDLEAVLIALGWSVVGVAFLLIDGAPPLAAWPYAAFSGLVHAVYMLALGRSYKLGELTHVYTLARGLPPLMIALGAFVLLGETPSEFAMLGIAFVSVGVLATGLNPHAPAAVSAWAVFVAIMIAVYSVTDAVGVRVASSALSYTGATTLASAVCLFALAPFINRPRVIVGYVKRRWTRGVLVGGVSTLGYTLVLWAQMRAPVATISALRETSIIFAAVIGVLFLRERLSARRALGVGLAALGAVLIALV